MWVMTSWSKLIKVILTVFFLICSFILFLLIYFNLAIAQPFRVSGNSMSPTLRAGQYFIADERIFSTHPPQRGDIFVMKNPQSPDQRFIKRIIGLPGETIKIQDGHVFINNNLLDEPYLTSSNTTAAGTFLKEGQIIDIPVGYYFVLGDNRPGSFDSREFGLVPSSYLVGKYWFSY